MYIILNLFCILGIALLITAMVRSRTVRWAVSFAFGFFITLQLGSLYFGGSFIDYKFYVHFNLRDMMQLKNFFILQVIFFSILWVALSVLLFKLRKQLVNLGLFTKKHYNYITIIASIFIMGFNEGIIGNFIEIVKIVTVHDENFRTALYNLEMEDYIPSDEVKAQKGKNIIVISLESFERGYLSDLKKHLTPNLRSLAKRWNYYDMNQTPGGEWTSGSLYTYLTGVPAFFKGRGNSFFEKSYDSRITGIGHILKKANYQTTYLVGDATFSGTEYLLNTFQIRDIIDHRKLNKKYVSGSWGVHDKDLFEEAKSDLLSKKNAKDPFALFISTTDTHNPDGVYDSRMEGEIAPQKTNLEFMVSAVDKMLGDFIDFLEKEDILSNTIIYIFPDHLKMGDPSIFYGTGNRKLYLITNASIEYLSYDTYKEIYQIDLPKIILDGASISHNAKFLTNYIKGDKIQFIRKNVDRITALNNSGLKREGIWVDKLIIELLKLNSAKVKFNKNELTISKDTLDNFITSLSFNEEMRMIKTDYYSFMEPIPPSSNLVLNLFVKNGILFSSIQKGVKIPLLKTGIKKLEFTLEDIENLSSLPDNQKLGLFSWEDSKLIKIISSPQKEYTQFFTDVPYNIIEGFIELEYSTKGNARPFVILYGQPYTPETIALQYNIPCSSNKNVIRLPFNKSVNKPALLFRNWATNGDFFVYNYRIIGNGYDNGTRFIKKTTHFDDYAKDISRFIAHAGGSIEGNIYTNSLEALDYNYEKGFRLFELDILKTSDGKYVAAHDWEHWAKTSGYNGTLPVPEEEFLLYKINGKYTPLNMEAINNWFRTHKDAILITDKTNEPKQFLKAFIDKDRLMMELFSISSLKEGLALGIKSAMPSENVLEELGKDKVAMLKLLGVKDITVSRRYIAPNITFLERLKNSNIRVYVYHVNFDAGKDENYVVNYEMDYIYGIYADNWDFK